jgi:hypothetical protein
MAEFTYTPNASSLRRFLAHIREAGVPTKVTQTHLKSVGFKSGNDTYIIPVLKFIGFLDGSGMPTAIWKQYRDKQAGPAKMAAAVRAAYADLFIVYPDAHKRDDATLLNYFSGHTTLAKTTVGYVVRTFKTLCAHADFEAAGELAVTPSGAPVEPSVLATPERPAAPPAPSITIAIQLQLPPTDDATVYDNLFAAMKRHLFS